MEMFTGWSGRREESHTGHDEASSSSSKRVSSWVYVHIRTVDPEEDHIGEKTVHSPAADVVPGLAVVSSAVIRLHIKDGVVLPKTDEAPFPVKAVPLVSHRGSGVAAAGEYHRTPSDDVISWTDGQGHSIRRIWWETPVCKGRIILLFLTTFLIFIHISSRRQPNWSIKFWILQNTLHQWELVKRGEIRMAYTVHLEPRKKIWSSVVPGQHSGTGQCPPSWQRRPRLLKAVHPWTRQFPPPCHSLTHRSGWRRRLLPRCSGLQKRSDLNNRKDKIRSTIQTLAGCFINGCYLLQTTGQIFHSSSPCTRFENWKSRSLHRHIAHPLSAGGSHPFCCPHIYNVHSRISPMGTGSYHQLTAGI